MSAVKYKKLADFNFVRMEKAPTTFEKKQAQQKALENYHILSKIEPLNTYSYVQLARIYEKKKSEDLIKENFSTALSINSKDPYANYFYGEYFYSKEKYRVALKYYLIAYKNGYKDVYILNKRLAELYKKLGDINKSDYYNKHSTSIK